MASAVLEHVQRSHDIRRVVGLWVGPTLRHETLRGEMKNVRSACHRQWAGGDIAVVAGMRPHPVPLGPQGFNQVAPQKPRRASN